MTELTPSQWAEVDAALEQGSVIDAIRIYRGHAQCTLVTAKAAIDARRAQQERDHPERFQRRSGCGPIVVLLVAVIGGLIAALVWRQS